MYIPARLVLYIMSACGFFTNYMLRSDINIAIVAMVRSENATKEENAGKFSWSPEVQNIILGAFYWINPIAQFTGGWIVEQLGCRKVYGSTQFIAALCSLSIPQLSRLHFSAVIALKVLQGLISGTHWPAMYSVVGHWIPLQERSRFMSSFQCFNAGIGVAYIISGGLISLLGWQAPFYATSGTTIAYCVCWCFLVYDTPDKHPRISEEEKAYIKANIGVVSSKKKKIPYGRIILSPITWAIAISNFGRIIGSFMFYVTGPQYMQYILHFDYKSNGIISGVPFVLSYVSCVMFGWAADYMINHEIMTKWNVRRLFCFIAQFVPGLICFIVPYVGCWKYITVTLVLWFIAVICGTATSSGNMATPVDVAPNYAGSVIGIAQTFHITACHVAPLIVGLYTKHGHTCDAWRNAFFTAGGLSCGTYLVFHFLGSADEQPWNKLQDSDVTLNDTANTAT